jgi:hypothetical protein
MSSSYIGKVENISSGLFWRERHDGKDVAVYYCRIKSRGEGSQYSDTIPIPAHAIRNKTVHEGIEVLVQRSDDTIVRMMGQCAEVITSTAWYRHTLRGDTPFTDKR